MLVHSSVFNNMLVTACTWNRGKPCVGTGIMDCYPIERHNTSVSVHHLRDCGASDRTPVVSFTLCVSSASVRAHT